MRVRTPGRAFTLIELLVVIGIIAVLMSILLPSLAGARRTARAAVGVANLRSLSQIMFVYANASQGQFLTPFRAQWEDPERSWTDIIDQEDRELVWSTFVPADPRLHTELFAYYWYSYLQKYYGLPRLSKDMYSPADQPIASMAASLASTAETRNGWVLWPSSFLYSPTMWTSPARYTGSVRQPMAPNFLQTQGPDTITHPAAKVFLFERMDFRQVRRAGSQTYPPAFNNPRARINAATVDGSVSEVDVGELVARGAQDEQYAPVDQAQAPDGPPLLRPYVVPQGAGDPMSWPTGGEGATDLQYPLFFWSTRNGARGRDLPR